MSDKAVPPWEDARQRLLHKRKTAGARSEAGLGGALQINSGRHWFSKRDTKKLGFLFENRQTQGKTITVNAEELEKIAREAIFENSFPAMRLDFTNYHEDWVLIRRSDFESLSDENSQLIALVRDLNRRIEELENEDA